MDTLRWRVASAKLHLYVHTAYSDYVSQSEHAASVSGTCRSRSGALNELIRTADEIVSVCSVSLGRSGTKGDGKVEGVDGLNLDRCEEWPLLPLFEMVSWTVLGIVNARSVGPSRVFSGMEWWVWKESACGGLREDCPSGVVSGKNAWNYRGSRSALINNADA
ncbi:uncharacterized protein FOMMEDRAFT_161625 [Fomitiporia mediterranea MF3/22]|uniref:uncharacterized protein n=1 Tax=Fomitiporia mediterranea (strain MF3/22) TaxID=694068 RepID=UPI000440870C|nr:uncharacterized protein FOMMEDRAFT_161625 [Fomitiporia mediterranea MF3/22]EJC98790.1 hypothetical protein FOMMEDRAFT_161625 [Fomitiporia mediterranea MF3/22]